MLRKRKTMLQVGPWPPAGSSEGRLGRKAGADQLRGGRCLMGSEKAGVLMGHWPGCKRNDNVVGC